MSKAIEQRVKAKLKQIEAETNTPFNTLLDTLFLERILVRVARSKHSKKLIFKGGMCLSKIIPLNRQTRDIDFLAIQTKASLTYIKDMMNEVLRVPINDGFTFDEVDLQQLPSRHKKHPGFRVLSVGRLGQVVKKVTIDIGIGDVVRPNKLQADLIGINKDLFEKKVSLVSYPPEFIFSEKLEAILYLGELNSRMKDLYDCYYMIEENVLNYLQLRDAIFDTMRHRGTNLTEIPMRSKQFEDRWNSFLKKNKLKPIQLSDLVAKINATLKEHVLTKT